jgi:outer membrane protein OmpA-like peptidoglycan-associated protein
MDQPVQTRHISVTSRLVHYWRLVLVALVGASLTAAVVGDAFAKAPGSTSGDEAKQDKGLPPDLPPLEVKIDKAKVDLDQRKLEVRMNQPASRVVLKVYDESGFELYEGTQSFEGRRAGQALVVRWKVDGEEPVGRIEVFAYDKWDRFQGIAIVPWSFSVPHEEVEFENNSAEIRPSEEPKLKASLKLIQDAIVKYEDLGPISLFIAGHTDTLGMPHHNKTLSRNRARAIATWFKTHGMSLPILYEGFGESSLKVKTPDETAEPHNRRVDYVLSIDTPRYKTTRGKPIWRKL